MPNETPEIKQKLKELESEFSQYKLPTENKTFSSAFSSTFSSALFVDFSSYKFYLSIMGGIFAILVLFRPSFLYRENKHKKKHFSLKSFIFYWFLFSILIISGVFIYTYKKA